MPAPKPTEEKTDPEPSAALSQLGKTWPVTARVVGLVIGADSRQAHVAAMLNAMQAAAVVALVVAPTGGKYGNVTAHRTYANAASTEFDALVVIGATPPAPDAVPALDAKSGAGDGPAARSDPRVIKLLQEAWRHAKAIGSIDDGIAKAAADIPSAGVGIATGNGKDLPRFLQGSLAAARQAQRTPGFLDGRLRVERDGTFWTLTLWESGRDMTGFRDSGIHAVLTRHLADWASEAAFGVWSTDSAELPAWDRASRQLAAHPRFPPFDAPAPAPRNGQAPTARRFGLDVPIPTRRTPAPAPPQREGPASGGRRHQAGTAARCAAQPTNGDSKQSLSQKGGPRSRLQAEAGGGGDVADGVVPAAEPEEIE